jgi:CheY-like chemotaxis protein
MGSATLLAGRSILIVDDEPLIALHLKELFESEGAKVFIAASPARARSLCRSSPICRCSARLRL